MILRVHPYIAAFIKKGLPSLRWKWFFKYGCLVKVIPIVSYTFMEYHFFNSYDEELIHD